MAPGNTPLMRAVENGHAGVVALLLDAAKQRQRPIAKRRNMKGETALHKAAATGAHLTPLHLPHAVPHVSCVSCVVFVGVGVVLTDWVAPRANQETWRWRGCWWSRGVGAWM
jgi:hypothetical protein